jgi:hypothetical protein
MLKIRLVACRGGQKGGKGQQKDLPKMYFLNFLSCKKTKILHFGVESFEVFISLHLFPSFVATPSCLVTKGPREGASNSSDVPGQHRPFACHPNHNVPNSPYQILTCVVFIVIFCLQFIYSLQIVILGNTRFCYFQLLLTYYIHMLLTLNTSKHIPVHCTLDNAGPGRTAQSPVDPDVLCLPSTSKFNIAF